MEEVAEQLLHPVLARQSLLRQDVVVGLDRSLYCRDREGTGVSDRSHAQQERDQDAGQPETPPEGYEFPARNDRPSGAGVPPVGGQERRQPRGSQAGSRSRSVYPVTGLYA